MLIFGGCIIFWNPLQEIPGIHPPFSGIAPWQVSPESNAEAAAPESNEESAASETNEEGEGMIFNLFLILTVRLPNKSLGLSRILEYVYILYIYIFFFFVCT